MRAEVPGAAVVHLVDGVALLRPEEQVFAAMLDGWRAQQLARNLAFGTIEKRLAVVRAFAAQADALPWAWRPQLLDEWLRDLRGAPTAPEHDPQLRLRGGVVLLVRHRPVLRLGRRVRAPVRLAPGAGGPRVEHRGARPGRRG